MRPVRPTPDEEQGTVAQRLGGLRARTLSFGDGEGVGGEAPLPASVEHEYKKPGPYVATLTVEDADGVLAEASVHLVFGRGRRAS